MACELEVAAQPAEVLKVRDRALSENIGWVLEREGADTKMVVWAHFAFNQGKVWVDAVSLEAVNK